MDDGYKIGAYSVEGKVNYDDTVKKFGIGLIDDALKARIKKDAGEVRRCHQVIRTIPYT